MKTYVEFHDGNKMPIVGYGMWQADDPQQLEAALDKALEVGYRHFDTAFTYYNEEVFGKVLKRWLSTGKVKREELFIVTKLPVFGSHPDRVEPYLKLSLERLQLDYVDLYLIHNPACLKPTADLKGLLLENGSAIPDTSSTLEELWKAMEAQVKAGRTKSIGVSNFSPAQVERIVKVATIKPANIQVELNVYYQKKPLRDLCAKHGITVCAFAPLGSPGRAESYKATGAHTKVQVPPLLSDPVILEIAKKHNKTPAQVLLKALTQQGIVVIPKSVTPARIAENFNIFDFDLDADSLAAIVKLDTGKNGTWAFDWVNGQPGIEKHPEFQLE